MTQTAAVPSSHRRSWSWAGTTMPFSGSRTTLRGRRWCWRATRGCTRGGAGCRCTRACRQSWAGTGTSSSSVGKTGTRCQSAAPTSMHSTPPQTSKMLDASSKSTGCVMSMSGSWSGSTILKAGLEKFERMAQDGLLSPIYPTPDSPNPEVRIYRVLF